MGRESEVARLVAAVYEQAGAEVEVFAVEQGRDNACGVVRGAGGGRSLLYNGHIDVVPPGNPDLWTDDPFSGERRDGRILGRGSTDMKAGVLAQAYAAVALQRAGVRLQGDLTLVAVVGEEVGDHERGTTATIERGYGPTSRSSRSRPRRPSRWPSCRSRRACCGSRCASAARPRTPACAARPCIPTIYGEALGVNAIDKAFLVYETFRRLEDEWAQTKRHPLFPNGKFALLPGVIHGSPHGIDVPFFLAESCTIEYCVAFHPDDTCASTKEEITRRLELAAQLDPWLREHPPTIEWKLEWEPYRLAPDHAMCRRWPRRTSAPPRARGWPARRCSAASAASATSRGTTARASRR